MLKGATRLPSMPVLDWNPSQAVIQLTPPNSAAEKPAWNIWVGIPSSPSFYLAYGPNFIGSELSQLRFRKKLALHPEDRVHRLLVPFRDANEAALLRNLALSSPALGLHWFNSPLGLIPSQHELILREATDPIRPVLSFLGIEHQIGDDRPFDPFDL